MKKTSLASKIDNEYKSVFSLTRRNVFAKMSSKVKFWTNRRKPRTESKMDKIKQTISTLPKIVSLVVLTSGFIYAGWNLAQNEQSVRMGVVLLALFLVRESHK